MYKGRSDSSKGVDPGMNHRRGPTVIYMGCGESLNGVDPSTNHCPASTAIYKGCGESLTGIDSQWFIAGGLLPFKRAALTT